MRLLLYNICYGIGIANTRNLPLHGARYLIGNTKNVTAIANFIDSESPDIVGLIEVDTGSIRTRQTNQAQFIADVLGHYTAYECKYAKHSINQYLPIVRKQSNAFLAEDTVHGERFHYFNKGVKGFYETKCAIVGSQTSFKWLSANKLGE